MLDTQMDFADARLTDGVPNDLRMERNMTGSVEDIDLGVTRQEGRVTPRIITRSPELSFRIMGQRWAETRIWLKARSYNHCYSRLVV